MMKPFSRKRGLWILAGVLFLVAGMLLAVVLLGKKSDPVSLDSPSKESLAGLDQIVIDAELEPEKHQMTVHQQMKLTNRTDDALEGVVLRTLANAYASLYTSPYAIVELFDTSYPNGFSTGSLSIQSVLVDGEPFDHEYLDEEKTVCFIPCSWAKGEEQTVQIEYVVNLPQTACRFGYLANEFSLGDALIYPAADQGAKADQPMLLGWGDPPETACVNEQFSLTVPDGWLCIGSGQAESFSQEGKQTYRFTAEGIRSFGLCVFPKTCVSSRKLGSTEISCYAGTRTEANALLRYAEKSFRCYQELFGSYPYPVLNVKAVSLSEGAAYPSLLLVPEKDMISEERLEESVSLLMARQWWSLVLTPERFTDSWMSESLCVYSHLLYLQKTAGASARAAYEETRVIPAARLTQEAEVTPGAPLDHFAGFSEFHQVAGEKGCAMLIALELFSEGKMQTALSQFYRQFRFSMVSRQEFTDFFSDQLGKDIAPLLTDYLDTNY